MIIRFIKSVRYSLLLQKAFQHTREEKYNEALHLLDKCHKVFSEDKIQASLLKSLIFYERNMWKESLLASNHSIEKINNSKSLNKDEKKYLIAFATDTKNCIILKTQDEPTFIPVDMSFDRESVDKRYRFRFKVKPR